MRFVAQRELHQIVHPYCKNHKGALSSRSVLLRFRLALTLVSEFPDAPCHTVCYTSERKLNSKRAADCVGGRNGMDRGQPPVKC